MEKQQKEDVVKNIRIGVYQNLVVDFKDLTKRSKNQSLITFPLENQLSKYVIGYKKLNMIYLV